MQTRLNLSGGSVRDAFRAIPLILPLDDEISLLYIVRVAHMFRSSFAFRLKNSTNDAGISLNVLPEARKRSQLTPKPIMKITTFAIRVRSWYMLTIDMTWGRASA